MYPRPSFQQPSFDDIISERTVIKRVFSSALCHLAFAAVIVLVLRYWDEANKYQKEGFAILLEVQKVRQHNELKISHYFLKYFRKISLIFRKITFSFRAIRNFGEVYIELKILFTEILLPRVLTGFFRSS